MIIKRLIGLAAKKKAAQDNTIIAENIDSTLDKLIVGSYEKPGFAYMLKDYISNNKLIMDIYKLKEAVNRAENHIFDSVEKMNVIKINDYVTKLLEQANTVRGAELLKTKYAKVLTLAIKETYETVKKVVKMPYYEAIKDTERANITPNMSRLHKLYSTVTGLVEW